MRNDQIDSSFPAIHLADNPQADTPAELCRRKLKELADRPRRFRILGDRLRGAKRNDAFREMLRAMERHQAGQARVIPIILRQCDWQSAPFGKLQAAPRDGKPVRSWPDYDEAFLDIVLTIRAALGATNKSTQAIPPKRSTAPTTQSGFINQPRSSNLSLRRSFTDADRDTFLDQAFEYMARFFENSLNELRARNPGIGTSFKRGRGS